MGKGMEPVGNVTGGGGEREASPALGGSSAATSRQGSRERQPLEICRARGSKKPDC